jgi:hypothetical protein
VSAILDLGTNFQHNYGFQQPLKIDSFFALVQLVIASGEFLKNACIDQVFDLAFRLDLNALRLVVSRHPGKNLTSLEPAGNSEQ